MDRTLRPRYRSVLSLVAVLAACKTNPEPAPDAGEAGAGGEAGAEVASSAAPEGGGAEDEGGKDRVEGGAPIESEDPRGEQVTITRAEAAASVTAKGAKNMGFSLDKIWHLFALGATPKLPDWGAKGEGDPRLAHDDDLDTAWVCEFGQASPCVLGLGLPEPGKVEAIRLYSGAGPRFRDYTGHPRVAKLRVHTDIGHVDVDLADGANHTYVRFAEAVTTQSLALEVLDVHAGKQDKLVHFAEVEVYGADGVPRPPIVLDPEAAWASWETTVWGGPELDHTIRQIFIRHTSASAGGEPSPPKRLARATAVYGQAADDYALFERLNGTDCEAAEGGYVLFDKRSRMYYPIGDLGGAGAEVYRHTAGHGFAVGWSSSDGQFTIKGIIEEEGKLKRKRPPKAGVDDPAAQLREWGFDPKPLSRGEPLTGAVPGCHRAGAGELTSLAPELKDGAPMDPAQWMVCSVGADTLYASASCDGPALAYQLDTDGKLVGKHESKADDARGLRLRRAGDQLYVELSAKGGDTASLYLAAPGAFTQLERNGGLAARPPSSCRPCADAWLNPEAALDDPEAPDPEADGELDGDSEGVFEGESDAEDEAAPGDADPGDAAPAEPAAPPAPEAPPGPR